MCGRAAAWQANTWTSQSTTNQKALHPGRPFKDLVAETIRQGLMELSAKASASTSGGLAITDEGLPVFRRDPSDVTPFAGLDALQHGQ